MKNLFRSLVVVCTLFGLTALGQEKQGGGNANLAQVTNIVVAIAVNPTNGINSVTATNISAGIVSASNTTYQAQFAVNARTLTVAGTANQITSSAGAQDLSANRTWTLSFPNILIAPGTLNVTGNQTNQGNFSVTGSSTNFGNAYFKGSINGSGANLTSLNGNNVTAGTLNSNAFDVGTAQQFAFIGDASQLMEGIVPPAQLGSGSSISGKFLRGDSTWQSITGGGDMLKANNLSDVANATLALANLGGAPSNNASMRTVGITNTLSVTNGNSVDLWFATGQHLRSNNIPPFNWRFDNTNGFTTIGTNGVTKVTFDVDGSITLPSVNGGQFTANRIIGNTGQFDQALSSGSGNFSVNGSGGVTLYSLTHNSLLFLDGSDAVTALGNGTGVLTNDGSGNIGFSPKPVLNGAAITNVQAANITGLLDASSLGANQYAATGSTTNLVSTQNGNSWTNISGTNIVLDTGTLAPTSNATNYQSWLAQVTGTHTIYPNNTNINLSLLFTNLADVTRTICVDNSTGAVNCNLTFTFSFRTNQQFSATVSNGFDAYYNFSTVRTSGVVRVGDAGRWH